MRGRGLWHASAAGSPRRLTPAGAPPGPWAPKTAPPHGPDRRPPAVLDVPVHRALAPPMAPHGSTARGRPWAAVSPYPTPQAEDSRPASRAPSASCVEGMRWAEMSPCVGLKRRFTSVRRNGSRSFRLTTTARAALDSRIKYKKRSARDQRSELVRAYLDVNEDIGRSEAASLLRVGETRASAILSDLYNKHGLIKPVGAARGRGVRYTLAK